MYGYLAVNHEEAGRRPVLTRRMLCGLSVLQASVSLPETLSPRRQERRIGRAAAKLWENGVNRVLLPREFPWTDRLLRAGLLTVDTLELCRACAAQLTVEALLLRGREPERSVVALAGEKLCRAVLQAAEGLAPQVSGLKIEIPAGGRELAAWLQEEYGLPVLRSDGVRPALTVVFDEGWEGRGPALRLYGREPDLLGTELWKPGLELPEECDPMTVLAALWESGSLAVQELRARPAGNAP